MREALTGAIALLGGVLAVAGVACLILGWYFDA